MKKLFLIFLLLCLSFVAFSEDAVKQYVVNIDGKNAEDICKIAKEWIGKQNSIICDDSIPSEKVECKKTYDDLMSDSKDNNLFYRIMIKNNNDYLVYVLTVECKENKARFSYYADYNTMLKFEPIAKLQIENFERYCNQKNSNDW